MLQKYCHYRTISHDLAPDRARVFFFFWFPQIYGLHGYFHFFANEFIKMLI